MEGQCHKKNPRLSITIPAVRARNVNSLFSPNQTEICTILESDPAL
jgi:hypothetical protein